MFKLAIVIFAFISCAAAKPAVISTPFAYTAPTAAVIAAPAPVVTATSSQFIGRNYNGIATAPVVSPIATPVVAAFSAPLAVAAPLAYSAPLVAIYTNAYAHPLTYSAPFTYGAAAPSILL